MLSAKSGVRRGDDHLRGDVDWHVPDCIVPMPVSLAVENAKADRESKMERFNMSMRKYLKEVGVTSQQAIERVVREEKLASKGNLRSRWS